MRFVTLVPLVTLMALPLAGCSKGSDTNETDTDTVDTDTSDTDTSDTDTSDTDTNDTDTDTDTGGTTDAMARMVNNIWDRTTVAAKVQGASTNITDDFPEGAASGYTNLFTPGSWTIDLTTDGNTIGSVTANLEAGKWYTVIAYGAPDLGMPIVGVQLEDDNSPTTSGMVRVRPFNSTLGLPGPVTITVDGTATWSAVAAGTAGDATEVDATATHTYGIDMSGDGVPELECPWTADETKFGSYAHLVHVTMVPDQGQGVAALVFQYPFGFSTNPADAVYDIAPCTPVASAN